MQKKIESHQTCLVTITLTVVIAIDETIYSLTVFDALKIILRSITLVSCFSKISWAVFEVETCIFFFSCTFQ